MYRGYIKGILYMVYLKSINGDKPVITGKKNVSTITPQQNQKKVKVVPVGQKEEIQTEDIDKLPQGYYVERTGDDTPSASEPVSIPTEAPTSEPTEAPDEKQNTPDSETTSTTDEETPSQDDDLPDTKMHTDERIELSESITIANDQIKPIQDALDNAIRRGQMAMYKKVNPDDDQVDYIINAETMMKHDTFQPLEMEYKKGLHASGLARFEVNDLNYDFSETATHIRWKSNTERIDLTGTYESKSGNTKLFGFLKGTVTHNNVSIDNPELKKYSENTVSNNYEETEDGNDDPDIPPMPDLSNIHSKSSEYCAYLGLKQKFNNGTTLSATGFHDKNESQASHTTQFNALYDLGFADITGSAVIYKLGEAKATVKTDLSCKFKTFDKPADKQTTTEQTTEEQPAENNNNKQESQTTKTNGKKWDKKGGLLLEFESEDDPEQGIGYYWDFRKNEQDSNTKLTFFGKASTTQRGEDETSSYHITTGANLQYTGKISPKYTLDLDLDVKDKFTFGGEDKGNITTAFGRARLASQKLIAELEGKLILAKDTYKALALRLAYKLNPKVEISAEGAVVDQNETGVRLRGYTGLTTLHVTF